MRRLLIALLTGIIFFGTAIVAQAVSIVWTSPASDATNVDVAIGEIWVEFDDQHMDGDSYDGRVTVDNDASFTVSKVNNFAWTGDFLKITLAGNLKYSTTYTVTVNKNVKNKDGVKLGTTYNWSFTTMAKPVTDSTPPVVSSTSPVSNAVDVPVTSQIGITFSDVMDPATITSSTIRVDNGAVTGTVSLDASGKVVMPGFIRTDVSVNALTATGAAQGTMDAAQASGMDPLACAERIWRAVAANRSEATMGGLETWVVLLKRLSPTLVDHLMRRVNVT